MKKIATIAIAGVLSLVAGCQSVSTTSGGAVGVGREQSMFMLLSSKQVDQMSSQAYTEQLTEAKQKKTLNQDAVTVARLNKIADRLVAQVGIFRRDARQWKWEVNLLQKDELNAYCMPGGKIMFYSGIIKQLNLSDAEIAAIMGHEMAHALREHGRESMSRAYAVNFGLLAVTAAAGLEQDHMKLARQVADVAITLPNSRTAEAEADLIGLELMARAGYDPQAAVSLWKKMSKAGGQRPPEFLSTHPSTSTRIEGLQHNIPKVLPFYKAAPGRT